MIAFYEEMSINNKLFEVCYVKNDTFTHEWFKLCHLQQTFCMFVCKAVILKSQIWDKIQKESLMNDICIRWQNIYKNLNKWHLC